MGWADKAVRNAMAPGGEDSLFNRYAKYFNMLDSTDFELWQGEVGDKHAGDSCITWFSFQAEVVKVFAEILNINEDWIREDYQEMNELLIVFFGGQVQRRDTNGAVYSHVWRM